MANHKPGWITASTIGPFLTGKSGKLIQGGINAAREIAGERSGSIDPEQDNGFTGLIHTDWGNEHEADAIAAYEAREFVEVHGQQEQFEVIALNGLKTQISCTPDGLVGEEGMIEVKCPSVMKNHRNNVLRNEWVSQYQDQCQFQMLVTGRKWVDLISFDPRQSTLPPLHVFRIHRDESRINFMIDRITQAEAEIANELLLEQAVLNAAK